ncbi:MAG: hypothetical protein COT90_04910 [Candidatus Diapherotrites archaeon CG10_big_fil_rev_8_21_14_0_10_31_34]|nr:MAG: hypothetical protein COT90_04910 [Candidatus Diapherotrites archaeon CG10_big_fil_rev_8_21_14_0_10_31_34]
MDELDIWDPFKKMRKQENLSGFFDSFPSFPEMDFDARIPLLDVKDKGNKLKITVELPGIKKETSIDLTENQFELNGEMTLNKGMTLNKEKKELDKGYFFREKKSNSYYNHIGLADEKQLSLPKKPKIRFNSLK